MAMRGGGSNPPILYVWKYNFHIKIGSEKMNKIEVEVTGTGELLMNRFIDTQIDSKSKKRTGSLKESDVTDKLYLDDGKPYIPSVYFRNCLIEAGKQFKITGKGKSNFSKLIGATVDIETGIIKIKSKEGYDVFRISAVNPMTKGRMMVSRPRFKDWSCKFTIVLNDDGIEPNTIKEILDHAGKYVGIGDWRPEKKGMYGKFIVVSFKEV